MMQRFCLHGVIVEMLQTNMLHRQQETYLAGTRYIHWVIALFGFVFRWDQILRPNGSTSVLVRWWV